MDNQNLKIQQQEDGFPFCCCQNGEIQQHLQLQSDQNHLASKFGNGGQMMTSSNSSAVEQHFGNCALLEASLCSIPPPPGLGTDALLLRCLCPADASFSQSPDACRGQPQQKVPPLSRETNEKTCAWHKWIDQLVQEVRCEICAERLICIGRPSLMPPSSACMPNNCAFVGCTSSIVDLEQLLCRKREQNRAAARRYRHRTQRRMERERDEIGRLMEQNAKMRAERDSLRANIGKLKSQLAIRTYATSSSGE